MKINVFAGARRISLLIAAAWTVGCLFVGYTESPSVDVYYRGGASNATKLAACGKDDHREWLTERTPAGHEVSVTLCYPTFVATNGTRGIQISNKDGGNDGLLYNPYSDQAKEFLIARTAAFVLPADDVPGIEGEYRAALTAKRIEMAEILIGGLIAGWLLIAAVGWVMRGFLGIPRGSDNAPPKEA